MCTQFMPSAFVALFLVACPSIAQVEIGAAQERYDQLLGKGIEAGMPGLVVLADVPEQELWQGAKGVSDLASLAPMRVDDRFHLGSVSKLFTAVSALRLVDSGEFSLDMLVVDVLPEEIWRGIPFIEKINLEQLLDHSSGLYSFNNDPAYLGSLIGAGAGAGKRWTMTEMVALAKDPERAPAAAPGSGNHYSDTNYVLLALLVEHAMEGRFRDHIAKTMFAPLGMDSTYFLSALDAGELTGMEPPVPGYDVLSDELTAVVEHHESFERLPDAFDDRYELARTDKGRERNDAAGGVVSSARDLHRFARALFDGELLSPESTDWLLGPGRDLDEKPVGTDQQHVMRAMRMSYGGLLTMHGDGPGTNALLAYHEESGTIVIALTNIFGRWTEHELFRDVIVGGIIDRPHGDQAK